jgi:hypothetical protein
MASEAIIHTEANAAKPEASDGEYDSAKWAPLDTDDDIVYIDTSLCAH